MNNNFTRGLLAVFSLSVLTTLSACGGGGGGSPTTATTGGATTGTDASATLSAYAQNVVVATYADLDSKAATLRTTVTTLVTTPNTTNLTAAQQAWRGARDPWEKSEGFLFGPVDNQGLDPKLDSWPVNRVDLDAVLNGNLALTEVSIANLENTLRGFHTIEYLLFDNGAGSRVAADIVTALANSQRRRDYLVAATADLKTNTSALITSWQASGGNFANNFLTAGTGSAVYPSQRAAMQEIIEGMKTIADEVANGKINDPFSQHDGTLEESQFSDNSLEDFADNMRSIQNAYLGSLGGVAAGSSLSAFVASQNPTLDTTVKTQIQTAIDRIGAIPAPFRTAINDANSADEIQAAIDAITTLFQTLDTQVAPLVSNTAFAH